MRRWLFVLITLLIIGSLISWRLLQKRAQAQDQTKMTQMRKNAPASVELATVRTSDIVSTFEATGTVEAPENVKLAPKATGRVNFLQVREGDAVHRGQVLVRLDTAEVDAGVNQQRAALAEAQYRLAQAQLTQAPTNVSAKSQELQQRATLNSTRADYDQVSQNYDAQVAAAEASVKDTESKVKSATVAIANARVAIKSTQAGIKSAQANLDNAIAKNNRTQALFKQGFVSQQAVDDALTAVSVQQSALEVQQSSLEVAQGQLDAAQAALASAQAQQQVATQQASIVKNKGKSDIEDSRAHLEQAKAALQYAVSNNQQTPPAYTQSIAALKAGVAAARATLANAQALRADTVLVSPLDGVVTGRFMDPGGMASPGTPLLTVQFTHQVWVTIAVPENIIPKLHIGQPSTVHFDAYPDQSFKASIIQINPAADPQGRQFTVRVIMDNAKNLFKPGMFARVTLETEHLAHAVVVPREAVQQDRVDGAYVMVVTSATDAGGDAGKAPSVANRRPVIPGASDASNIQIISGVQPGDKVVTISAGPLKDGALVRTGGRKGQRGGGPGSAGGGWGGRAQGDGAPGATRHGHGGSPAGPQGGENPQVGPSSGQPHAAGAKGSHHPHQAGQPAGG